MRVARVRFARFAVLAGAVIGLGAVGGAPATAQQTAQGNPSFKVTISPAYATAGQWTTFEVTVANTSAPGTPLRSVQLTAPTGFTLKSAGSPWQHTGRIHGRTFSRQVSVNARSKVRFAVRATAGAACGKSVLPWSARAFGSATPSGPQFALQSALSHVGVTVVCPLTAACAAGGPACSTNVVTSVSTYAVVSNAGSGTLRQTLNVGNRLRCGAYTFRDPNWYDSAVTSSTPPPAGTPPIMDQISYTIKDVSQNGVGFCLGATYEFTTASGTPAPAGTLPNGNAGFIGMLPMCSNGAPPCISSISQQSDTGVASGHDAVMSIQVPELGDPWGSG